MAYGTFRGAGPHTGPFGRGGGGFGNFRGGPHRGPFGSQSGWHIGPTGNKGVPTTGQAAKNAPDLEGFDANIMELLGIPRSYQNTLGGSILGLASRDYNEQSRILREQRQREQKVTGQFESFLQGVGESADQYGAELLGEARARGGELMGLANKDIADLKMMLGQSNREAKNYFDQAISRSDKAATQYKSERVEHDATAAWASSQQFADYKLQIMNDPNLRPQERAAMVQQADLMRMGNLQSGIQQSRNETATRLAELRNVTANFAATAGSELGRMGLEGARVVSDAQSRRLATGQFVAGLTTQAISAGHQARMAAEQIQLAGYPALFDMTVASQEKFSESLGLGLLAMQMAQLGYMGRMQSGGFPTQRPGLPNFIV